MAKKKFKDYKGMKKEDAVKKYVETAFAILKRNHLEDKWRLPDYE